MSPERPRCGQSQGRASRLAPAQRLNDRPRGFVEHKGAIAKAASLKVWLSGLIATYDDKILPLDTTAAAIGGQLEPQALAAGGSPGMADAAIAGIAKAHDLTIVTGNLKHFSPFRVDVVLPDDLTGASH